MCDDAFGLIFCQQAVDALQIVERIVDEEAQLRNDAQLIVHPAAQLVAYRLLIGMGVAAE